jgi:hypothetical protein
MINFFSINTDNNIPKENFLDEEEDATVSDSAASAVWVAPCCLRYGEEHPLEASGLAMDAVARGTLIINYLFLVSSMI